MSYTGVTNTA